MEEYKQITVIVSLILSHWLMGFICYKLGRKIQKAMNPGSPELYEKLTNQTFEITKLENEIKREDDKIKLLELANEEMFEEGKRSIVKDTVKEMIIDHEAVKFEKIPQKKNLKEGGEDANNIVNRDGNSGNILLDTFYGT